MKRTKKWHKKITIAELRHILETTTSGALAQLKENRKFHTATFGNDLCIECRIIAQKLGIE